MTFARRLEKEMYWKRQTKMRTQDQKDKILIIIKQLDGIKQKLLKITKGTG